MANNFSGSVGEFVTDVGEAIEVAVVEEQRRGVRPIGFRSHASDSERCKIRLETEGSSRCGERGIGNRRNLGVGDKMAL